MTLAWYGLFIAACVLVPPRKDQRGYIWRLLRKLPPWRLVRGMSWARRYVRYLMLVFGWNLTLMLADFSDRVFVALSCGGMIVVFLDDYVNGDDDDRWKLGAWLRNTVRWRMALPPAPRGGDAR